MSEASREKTDEIHAGYEFETGMFDRMRSWVDVAPWTRLFRVLRLLASPVYIVMVVMAVWVSMLLGNMLGVELSALYAPMGLIRPEIVPRTVSAPLSMMSQTSFSLSSLVGVIVCLGIWTPVIQVVARAGASLTAARGLPPAGETLRLTWKRLLYSYAVPLLIIATIFFALLGLYALQLPVVLFPHRIVGVTVGWLVGLAAVPVGVLIAGSMVAIPIGWAAMICEKDPDPIDSLSRGFEALFRRPLQLVGYVVLAMLLVALTQWFSSAALAAANFAWMHVPGAMTHAREFQISAIAATASVAVAWCLTLQFGLLGGIYLLLRRDTGGQEVEDFWQPDRMPQAPLPDLPEQAYSP
ncbi:hypothetical protein [Roseiconus lacunae]|uniref:ABC transporter permease n=1 Tax=Roseiconus lacunae TaxID=2605694 RepID=A0ABT7PK16_9BACT|nr:hypothetical protein [Roseiconus lacunae]MDM4016820.1 hypothetical protein [Roseiconus lacunae]